MNAQQTTAAARRRRVQRTVLGAGIAGALVLGSATIAEAAGSVTPMPTPTASASTAAPSATPSATPTVTPTPTATPTATPTPTATVPISTGVVTIKGRTAGTGTNFSGTYRVGAAGTPAQGRVVDLQRKTPTGWETVQSDAADANGNVVFGTVQSNSVQTWRLVTASGTAAIETGVSSEFKVAKNGKAVSTLKTRTAGVRTGKNVTFTGLFQYRSWWITSGPDAGRQGLAAPLNTRVYLQYRSGGKWKNKAVVQTEDRKDAGVNVYFDVFTASSKARTWRLYYPGSSARTSAVSKTFKR